MKKLVFMTAGLAILMATGALFLNKDHHEPPNFSEVDRFLIQEALASSWRGGLIWHVEDSPSEGHGILGRSLQRIGIDIPGTMILIDRDVYEFSNGSDVVRITAFHVDEEMATVSMTSGHSNLLAVTLHSKLGRKFPGLEVVFDKY